MKIVVIFRKAAYYSRPRVGDTHVILGNNRQAVVGSGSTTKFQGFKAHPNGVPRGQGFDSRPWVARKMSKMHEMRSSQ